MWLRLKSAGVPNPDCCDSRHRNMAPQEDPVGETAGTRYPTKLIGRILQETFQNSKTRISRDALAVATEYLWLYAREAIWRAAQEKAKNEKLTGNFVTGVLEVDDLEKITGALTLDFS
jgi:hypothetical protein